MIALFLAYAVFIVVMALPYLVVAAIVGGFVGGCLMFAGGLVGGRPLTVAMGVALMMASGTAAYMIRYWIITPPPAQQGVHALVHSTYRGMMARRQAMRWMRDGTFERLAKDQRTRQAQPQPDLDRGADARPDKKEQ